MNVLNGLPDFHVNSKFAAAWSMAIFQFSSCRSFLQRPHYNKIEWKSQNFNSTPGLSKTESTQSVFTNKFEI